VFLEADEVDLDAVDRRLRAAAQDGLGLEAVARRGARRAEVEGEVGSTAHRERVSTTPRARNADEEDADEDGDEDEDMRARFPIVFGYEPAAAEAEKALLEELVIAVRGEEG
jgi:hypothetical protein